MVHGVPRGWHVGKGSKPLKTHVAEPAGQGAHAVEPRALYVLAPHVIHVPEVVPYMPAEHTSAPVHAAAVHADAPRWEHKPALHGEHADAPASEYVPPLHP